MEPLILNDLTLNPRLMPTLLLLLLPWQNINPRANFLTTKVLQCIRPLVSCFPLKRKLNFHLMTWYQFYIMGMVLEITSGSFSEYLTAVMRLNCPWVVEVSGSSWTPPHQSVKTHPNFNTQANLLSSSYHLQYLRKPKVFPCASLTVWAGRSFSFALAAAPASLQVQPSLFCLSPEGNSVSLLLSALSALHPVWWPLLINTGQKKERKQTFTSL